LALKKAELSDEMIVRMVELDGRPQPDVDVTFNAPITAAREVNGQEQPVGAATVTAALWSRRSRLISRARSPFN
jgi:alpha-mannosidase